MIIYVNATDSSSTIYCIVFYMMLITTDSYVTCINIGIAIGNS